jgi:hypothetical protein
MKKENIEKVVDKFSNDSELQNLVTKDIIRREYEEILVGKGKN